MSLRLSTIMRPAGVALLLVTLVGAMLWGCNSAEEYQRDKTTEQQSPPIGGELAISGSPSEIAWAREIAEALEAARLRFDLTDTVGAILTTDSLIKVAEAALDTLALENDLVDFLMLFVADAYGGLQEWFTDMGNPNAVAQLSDRYHALAARLQQRRDSAAAATEP
jgi:hypothetical protein